MKEGCQMELGSLSELRILLFLERCKTAFAQINSRQFVAFPQAVRGAAGPLPNSTAEKRKAGPEELDEVSPVKSMSLS